jgi:Na+/proline symporter
MLEQFRDIMIIISAFIVIGAALLFSILTIIIFRKVSPTLDAARVFLTDLKSVSSLVTGKVVKPITKGAIFAAGMRKAMSTLSKRSHRKEKSHDNGK